MVAAAIAPSPSRRLTPAHRVLGSAALVLGLAHLASIAVLPHSLWWMSILLVMTLWCTKCAWGVWQGAPAQKLLVMSALMGMLHMAMALGLPWMGEHHHSATAHSSAHGNLMLLLALPEFAVMFWAAILCHIQRSRLSLSGNLLTGGKAQV